MSVSTTQYVDLLFKKLQGVAKTANATVKSASNESIASPALLRGDIVWTQSSQIPSSAQVVSGVTQAYLTTSRIECVADTTVPTIGGIYPTWLTNLQYWIPQEFGSTWPVKVWVDTAGASDPTATGTQIFATGISGVGEFYFDTQAGVLNFIGETIPSTLTSGKSIFITGYRYVGQLGVTNLPNANIGNIQITGNTIATLNTNGNLVIDTNGTGQVVISSDLTVTGTVYGTFAGNISGNLTVPGSNTQVIYNNNGAAGASSGFTFDSATNQLSVAGNIVSANVNTGIVSASGNITGNYILGNGALLTGVITSVANINSGTSNVTVVAPNGNVSVGIGGTSNIAVFSTTGEYVTGEISATGNITGGNLITPGAGGDISGAGNVISGNVNTGIVSATGNIVGPTVNTSNISSTGNITVSADGNSWIFDTDGGITAAGIGVLRGSSNGTGAVNIVSAEYAQLQWTANAGLADPNAADAPLNWIYTNASGTTIESVNSAIDIQTWQFATDGTLTAPGNVTAPIFNSTSELTITTGSNGNLLLSADGTGIVTLTGGTGFVVPVGNTAQRPSPAANGTLRLNSTLNELEVYAAGSWQVVGSGSTGNTTVTDQQITPDGSTVSYTLDQVATAPSIMVAINGVMQTPTDGYTVTGNLITFSEAPLVSDLIDIRFLTAPAATPGVLYNSGANSSVQVNDVPEISFTVNNAVRTKITANGIVDISTGRSIKMPLYTVAQADALTGRTEGEMIYVQNGDSGAACLAVFTSGVWKRVVLGSAISG